MKKMVKIVVTGGPCGGKSTALARIKELAEGYGYRVLTVGESATELIGGGVAPWTCADNDAYQACQMAWQTAKESIFLQAAEGMPCDKILILFDRGMLDNKAYMSAEGFLALQRTRGETEQEYLSRYDAVFHLVTAACGAEAFYTTKNNEARTETPAEAREVDARLVQAWQKHPHHVIIENGGSFSDKMDRLLQAIASFLEEKDK